MTQLYLVVFCLLPFIVVPTEAEPLVSTRYGQVQGFEVRRRDGGKAEVFLGIPYAKPPVGELRFEKPELPQPWDGVFQATAFRNDCVPHVREVTYLSKYSGEDCLTFNVVRPKDRNKFLPVLLWVHGGGYEVGSASLHGYQAFVDNYVGHNVIVVSIQYRLGFLGFFTDGSAEAAGNIGLFDEAAALKFVYDNIDSFGGDKEQITVWGYSAGAGSVSHYTLSPYTRNYFSKAIIMSGSAFAGWATGYQVSHHCIEFAKAAGCKGPNYKDCLKQKSIEELFDAVEQVGGTTDNIDLIKFGPVIDFDYLPDHPNQLVLEAPTKPTLIGLSRKEGNFFTVLNNIPSIHSWGLLPENFSQFNESVVIKTIKDKLLYDGRFGANAEKALKKISNFYLTRGRPTQFADNGFFIDRYTEIMSDITFNVPAMREIKKKLEVGTPIWVYMFDHYNDALFKDHVPIAARGSPHANEYHYLFEIPMIESIDVNHGVEKIVRDRFIEIITSFTKNGKPSVSDIAWPQVQDVRNIAYLHLTQNASIETTGFFNEAFNFWDEMAADGFDVIDPMATLLATSHSRVVDEL